MAPTENGVHKEEIEEDIEANLPKLNGDPVYIPTIESGLMEQHSQDERFLDFLRAQPTDDWFLKSGYLDGSSHLPSSHRNSTTQIDEPAPAALPSEQPSRRFRVPFVRKINWAALYDYCKKWMKSPSNIAIFIWSVFVVVGLFILALVMFGALNDEIESNDRRKKWEEVINQILNALFMIMCLYQHPTIFHHLALLCRWTPKDQVEIRRVYCKDGAVRPHEWGHMMFVVALLHITCIAQYIMCAFFWAYSRESRPDWVVYACVVVGTASPILAGLYVIKSPLGRAIEVDTEMGEAALQQQASVGAQSVHRHNRMVVVADPEWIGGLSDCCDDPTVFCCSFFCTFCVFGWNMERLGFGNMYVHMFTFILLCIAPILVFGAAALNIDNNPVEYGMAIVGAILCVLGLIYGGVWRSEMRKKFKLPGNTLCCGYAWATDYLQWLFCWSCSLAQEVRTGNFYEIGRSGRFYSKEADRDGRPVLLPLRREGEVSISRSFSASPRIEPLDLPQASMNLSSSDLSFTFEGMVAPVPPQIQLGKE